MELTAAIPRIRSSTVQIEIDLQLSETSRETQRLGTGFIVHPGGWIITAAHVAEAAVTALSGKNGHILVCFAGPDIDSAQLQMRSNFVCEQANIVDQAQEHDLALLRTSSGSIDSLTFRVGPNLAEASPRPSLLDGSRPKDGTSVAVSGYPFGEPTFVTNAGVIATGWATESGTGPIRDRFLGDFTANPGNSGGPVYRVADATVIGVCVAGRLVPIQGGTGAQTAGLTVVVPAKYVLQLLERNGLAPWRAVATRPAAHQPKKKRRR